MDRMRELAPDLEPQTKASVLHLRPVTQALKDDGHEGVLPLLVLHLLRSLSMDGRGEDGPGSIDLRQSGPRSGQRETESRLAGTP